MEFRDPIFLLLALLAPLVFFWSSRLPARVTFSHLGAFDNAPRSLRVRFARLPALLLAIATILLAVAIARPRSGDATTVVSGQGIAIVMAVDRSGSMSALDFQDEDEATSRLEAVKNVFRQFVTGGAAGAGRPDDLIGLVAFGTYADGLCPLTLDHSNLVAILEDLDIASAQSEQGTALGEGLGLAVERLLGVKDAASRVVVLLTDGVSNAGVLDPLPAAELAAEHGIRVYTIGVGQRGYAPMPVPGRDGRVRLQRVFVETDETVLQQIAERTGGRFFRAEDTETLEGVYAEIDRLEKSEIVETRYLQYREHFAPLAAAAFALIFGAVLAAATVLRRLP